MQHFNPQLQPETEQTELLPVALFQHIRDEAEPVGVAPDLHTLLAETASQEWRYRMLGESPFLLEPMTQEPAPPETPPVIDLQGPTRLSESMLWQIQEDYYQRLGIEAWDSSVPFFITNSTMIAENYAEMIIGFLRDYELNLDRSEPVYIVEMASGCGRFAFHLLEELSRKLQCFASLRELKIRMVMTDFTDKNIRFWQAHEKMKPYIESGMLDFALFRPEEHQSLKLWNAGITLSRGATKNPMIALANYFFDSIRHDLFSVQSKQLKEGLVSLKRRMEGVESPEQPILIDEVVCETTWRPLHRENFYTDPRWNAVLRHYRHNVKNGAVIFPLGAFNCLKNLEAISDDNLVLLSSDKAFTTLEEVSSYSDHGYAAHGSFSYMVNYDAIGRYFQNAGGHFFFTTAHNLSLQTVCCIGVKHPVASSHYENLAYQYQEKVDRTNPINALNCNLVLLEENVMGRGNPPVDSLLAVLRTSLYDPRAYAYCAPWMIQHINNNGVTMKQKEDLMVALRHLWDRFYFMKGEISLPFWIGQTHFAFGEYAEALSFLQESERLYGEHESLCFFIACCHERLGDFDAARACLLYCLELNPDMHQAQELLALL